MFSRKKKNYRIFVTAALIICICVLIVALLWPKAPNQEINNPTNTEYSQNIEETPVMNPQKQEESTPTSNQTYYIVKKYGDVISVFFITEDGTQVKLEDTEIVYEVLPPEDQANFDKGIVVEEQEDLNTLLQDFEG